MDRGKHSPAKTSEVAGVNIEALKAESKHIEDPLELWERYTKWLYQNRDLGMYLDISRIGFSDEFFERAFKSMEELEKGAIANPDENRMVGHYWLRAPELAPRPSITKQLRFIDNTDPAGIDHVIAQLGDKIASTLVIVTSKSGGTPETRNGLLEVQKAFREAGLDFSKQAITVTQQKSLLDKTAELEGWLARFPMFDWIGGRTSELSVVGLLPAALQEIDIRAFIKGAKVMDEATRVPSIKENPAALLALSWFWATDGVGSKSMVVLPYKDSLQLFSRYLQQLVMESLGKEFDLKGNLVNQGIAVFGNKGSTDQHAYVQQLREGVPSFFVTFIEVLRDRPTGHDWELEPGVTCGDYLFGMLQGTREALYQKSRESITLTVDDVTPETVGAMIALYERAVGLYAFLVNINAYNQPGVEAGKAAAKDVLTIQKRVLQVLDDASCKEPVEALTLIILHMAANGRIEIAEGDCGTPRSITVFSEECAVEDIYDDEE
eukprot:jgi/Mesen1/4002/ME000211S03185